MAKKPNYKQSEQKAKELEKEAVKRQQLEEGIELTLAQLNQIFETATDGMLLIDLGFNVLRVSETFLTLMDINRDEAVGKRCYEICRCHHCHTTGCLVARILSGEERVECECEIECKDHLRILCTVTAVPLHEPGGELIGIVKYLKEITKLRRAEEVLRVSEEKYRSLVENIPDLIYTINRNGNFTSINEHGLEILGYRRDELIGQHFIKVIHPDDVEMTLQSFKEAVATKEQKPRGLMFRLLTKDSRTIWVALNSSMAFDERGGFFQEQGVARDITERKQSEAALRKSEEQYRSIFETVPASVILIDKDGQMIDINPYHLTHIAKGKFSKEDFIGKNIVTHPTIVNAGLSEMYKRVLEGEPFDQKDVYFPTLMTGGDGYFNVKGVPLLKDGEVIGAVTMHEDITDRKAAEKALRKSEQEKTAILNSIDELVVLQDKEYKILWANKAAGESADMIPEQLVGSHCYKIWAHRSDPCPDCPIAIAIETGHAQEIETYTSDGKAWFVRGYPIRDIQGNITDVVETTLEITERKRAEEALQESGKRLRFLSSQLITAQEKERRRISIELHDELGQALMVLKLQLRSMGEQLKEDQTALREECEQILHYIDDVTENVRRLSRDLSPSILEDLGILPALRWLIDEFTKHHPVESKLDIEDTPNLFSKEDEIIIFRIFQETLTNIGKHAQATHVSVIIKLQDGEVSFMVEDNGKGFNVEQIFSREATKRGMGLVTMEERARMVGGSLDIWSQEGTGTRITFSIPMN